MKRRRWPALAAAVLAAAAAAPGCDGPPVRAGAAAAVEDNNDQCFICHMPFEREPLTATHGRKKVWCRTCHGPSLAHMQDENIGATPPDVRYAPGEVAALCGKCHAPDRHPGLSDRLRAARLAAAAEAQKKVKGRPVAVAGVCTDCHGRHWAAPRN